MAPQEYQGRRDILRLWYRLRLRDDPVRAGNPQDLIETYPKRNTCAGCWHARSPRQQTAACAQSIRRGEGHAAPPREIDEIVSRLREYGLQARRACSRVHNRTLCVLFRIRKMRICALSSASVGGALATIRAISAAHAVAGPFLCVRDEEAGSTVSSEDVGASGSSQHSKTGRNEALAEEWSRSSACDGGDGCARDRAGNKKIALAGARRRSISRTTSWGHSRNRLRRVCITRHEG